MGCGGNCACDASKENQSVATQPEKDCACENKGENCACESAEAGEHSHEGKEGCC